MGKLYRAKFGRDRSMGVGTGTPKNIPTSVTFGVAVWLYLVVYADHSGIWYGRSKSIVTVGPHSRAEFGPDRGWR